MGVDTRGNRIAYWTLNLAEVSPFDFGSAKAGQLAVNYACDVATIAEKLGNFLSRANKRSPSVTRTWILLNPAHVMAVK